MTFRSVVFTHSKAGRTEKDFARFLKEELKDQSELPASDPFPAVRPEDLVIQGALPSALGLVPGTELLPGVRGLKLIGGDAAGEIWKAAVQDWLLALKVVPYAGKEVWCELEILSGVDRYHPHLLRGWAPGMLTGWAWFFMELAEENLYAEFNRIRDAGGQGYPATHLLEDLAGVAAALDSLVQRKPTSKLVHGAVRPSNLLRFGSTVKLGGFQEIRYFRSEADPPGVPLAGPYAAPEAAEGWPSQRSDQYSLALTYRSSAATKQPMANGVFIRDDGVLHQTINRERKTPWPPLTAITPSLSSTQRSSGANPFLRGHATGRRRPPPAALLYGRGRDQ